MTNKLMEKIQGIKDDRVSLILEYAKMVKIEMSQIQNYSDNVYTLR